MALRAREMYYFVRVGNYATRPLRQIEGDFRRLGSATDAASTRLERLQRQQQRLVMRRAALAQQIADPSAALALEQRRQGLIRKSAAVAGSLTGVMQSQAKVGRDLFANTTRQLAAELALEKATIRVVALEKAKAGEKRIQLARDAQQIAQRRVESATAARGGLVAQYDKLRIASNDLRMRSRELAVEFGKVDAAEAKNAATVAKLRAEYALLGEQQMLVQREMANIQRTMASQRYEQMGQAARGFRDFSRAVQFASGIVVLALGVMAHSAMEFNQQVAQAATQTGNNVQQMGRDTARITRGILNQMDRFPASAADMAKASYDIYSSLTLQTTGMDRTSQGMKVLDVANRASVAGMTSLEDATSGIVVMLNTFAKGSQSAAIESGQLNSMLNTAFATVRYGRITFGEFTGALATTAPAAKSANQSLGEMSGALAFLTRRMPVRQAAVSYARLLEVFQRAAPGLRKSGVEIRDATGRMRPLNEILSQIVKTNPRLAQGKKFVTAYFKEITKGAGAGTVGTIQARRAFTFLVTQFEQYRKILHQVNTAQGQFAESYEVMRKTAAIRWQVAMNRLHKLALEIGATVIPIFERMLEPIQRAVKWFNNLDESTKRHIVTITAWAGIIALIASTIGVVVAGVAGMALSFSAMAAVGEIGVVAALVAALPELIIVASVVAAIGYAWYRWPDQVGPAAAAVWTLSRAIASIAWQQFIAWVRRMAAPFITAANAAYDLAKAVVWLGNKVQPVVGWLRRLWNLMRRLGGLKPVQLIVEVSVKIAEGAVKKVKAVLEKIPGGKRAASILGGFLGINKAVGMVRGGIQTGRDILGAFGIGGDGDGIDRTSTRGTRDRLRSIMAGPTGPAPRVRRQRQEAAAAAQKKLNDASQRWVDILVKANREVERQPLNLGKRKRLYQLEQQMAKKFGTAQESAINDVVQATLSADNKRIRSTREVQKWVNRLVAANREVMRHPRNIQARMRLNRLEAQMAARFGEVQQSAINDVVQASLTGDKKRVKSAKKANKEILQDNAQAVDDMISKWQEFYDANKTAFGDITQQPLVQNMMTEGLVPGFRDFMGDITSQIAKFSTWRKELTQARKILPKGLVTDIQAAGPEAEPFLAGLLGLTPKQRKQYIVQWKKAQALIKKAADADFKNELGQWRGRGRKASLAFLKGWDDNKRVIEKRMTKLFTSWMQEHGARTTPRRRGNRKTSPTTRRRGGRKTQAAHTTVNHHHNNNQIHVHNNKEDLSTTLRKAKMAQKAKARRLHIR